MKLHNWKYDFVNIGMRTYQFKDGKLYYVIDWRR